MDLKKEEVKIEQTLSQNRRFFRIAQKEAVQIVRFNVELEFAVSAISNITTWEEIQEKVWNYPMFKTLSTYFTTLLGI